MSKKGRSMRGLHYEDAAREQAVRFRMIADDIIENTQPDRLKLRNGGGHRYQRRHLELIVYRTQYAKELVPHYLAPIWNPNYEDYPDGRGYHEVRPRAIHDGYVSWINDFHLGTTAQDRSSSLILSEKHLGPATGKVLSTKHFPELTPKADIEWPMQSDADVFMEALGHYTRFQGTLLPQLRLSDLANPEKPFEDRMVELGMQQMQRFNQNSRQTGKTLSATKGFMTAYDITAWYRDNMPFKLLPHQRPGWFNNHRPMLPLY